MVELAPQVKERVFIVPVELIETLDHNTNVLYWWSYIVCTSNAA